MRSCFMLGAAALLLGGVAACKDAKTISGPQVIQFSLDSIDGNVLPYEISRSADGTVTTEVTDMVLSISEDSKWRMLGHQTVTTNGVPQFQTLQGSGTFTVFDPNATFRDASGNIVYEGEVTNGDFRIHDAQGLEYYFAHSR
jgi:hypothetical protein